MEPLVLGAALGLCAGLYQYLRRRARVVPRRKLAGPRPLRVGDVVTHRGRDYLVEGLTRLEEPGRVSLLGRLRGDDGARHLLVRPADAAEGDEIYWMLDEVADPVPEAVPGAQVDLGGLRYRLALRYRAEALVLEPARAGSAPLSGPPAGAGAAMGAAMGAGAAPAAAARPDTRRLWPGEILVLEYRGLGAGRALLLRGAAGDPGALAAAYQGEAVPAHELELWPAPDPR